jgi:hypothetical protein
MKSHLYEFTTRDVLTIFGWPLVPLTCFAVAMHLGAATRSLPPPRPTLDVDRTILVHQAQASRESHDAALILAGDSSCLMDVSADQLGRSLEAPVLNLGTLSYLDLQSYATLIQQSLATNHTPPRAVLLLMHPEALRRPSPAEYHTEVLTHFYAQSDYCAPALSPLLCALGVEVFRGRLLARFLPVPLPGTFGRQYGFTHDLWDYLSAHHGSAVDPGQFLPGTATGNAEYRLAASLERTSKTFRDAVPSPIQLIVGITPVPKGFAPLGFAQTHTRLLQGWNQWLRADRVLDQLPATLPDSLFASATHLTAEGQAVYSALLAEALTPVLRSQMTAPP